MADETPHVFHGSDWAEHEDRLIGNRKGLEELRTAIDEALVSGESEIQVGEFAGVRCLDTEFFERTHEIVNTTGSKIGFVLIGIALVLTIFVVWLAKL